MAPDINDLDLRNEMLPDVDGNADPEEFFRVPILPDGKHVGVMVKGDKGVKINKQKDKDTGQRTGPIYVVAHVQLKSEDDDGSVFDYLTSLIFRGNSSLHAALALAGHEIPSRGVTAAQAVEAVEAALAQSPRVGFVTEWEAQVNDGTKDAPDYRTVLKGMKKFPPVLDDAGQPTGKYSPEVTDPKSGQPATAQARVKSYFKP